MRFEELDDENQGEARSLILAGLADHWGAIDETLNSDLDDMMLSFATGRTVLVRDGDGSLIGTGTLLPRKTNVAEILRMSVAHHRRGRGVGRRIVEELVSTATKWGSSVVVLETSSAWEDVISFYLGCGFAITHVENGEFGRDTWFERRLTTGEQNNVQHVR